MRWRRSLKIGLAAFAVFLAAVAAGAAFLIATEPGLQIAVAAANRFGAGDISIEGASGRLADKVAADRITVRDREGGWLRIDGARLAWSPLALLQRRLEIDSLSADRLVVERRPAEAEPDSGPDGGPPFLPVDVILRELDLPNIQLLEPVAGMAAGLSAAGNLTVPRSGRDMDVALTVRRTDQPGKADLRLRHDATSGLFDVQVEASAPAGGVVVRLLEVPGLPALSLLLSGKGRIDDMTVDLSASAGNDVSLTAAASLQGAPDNLIFDINGQATVAPMLPETVRPLATGPVSFAATARLADGNQVAIEKARVDADDLAVTAAGAVDLATRRMNLTLRAEGDVAPLAEVAGETGSGSFGVDATVTGSPDSPTVDYRIAVEDPAVAGAAAKRVSAAGKAALARNGEAVAVDVAGDLTASGLTVDGADLPVVGGDVTARYDMTVDTGSGDIAIRGLDASAGPASATVSGKVAADGRVDLAVRGQLADLARLGLEGLSLGGKAMANGTVASDDDGRYAVAATLGTADLSVDVAAAAALLGPAPTLSLTATVGADRTVEATRIDLTGAAMTASGSGRIGDDMSRVEASFDIQVPELAPLADFVGTGMDGGAAVKLTATGSLTSPDVSADLEWTDVRINQVVSPNGSAQIGLSALDTAPRGPVSMAATVNGLDLNARADLTIGDRLKVDGLKAAGPGLDMTGDLTVEPETGLIAGAVRGQTGDIAPYAALAGETASGALAFDATLSHSNGTQAVDARVNGERLRLEDAALSVASAQIDAQLTDLFGAPGGTVHAVVGRIAAGDTVVDDLDMRATLAGDDIDFDLQVNGPSDYGVALQAAGTTSVGGDAIDLSLKRMDGTVAAQAIALRAPARFRFGPGDLSIRGLDLAVGDGYLRGTAEITDKAMTGKLEAADLPFALAGPFLGEQTPTGFLDATLELDGQPEDPVAVGRVVVRELRMDTIAPTDELPPFGATIRVDWRGGRAALDGSVSGVPGTGASLQAAVPLVADFRSWQFSQPADGAVDVNLTVASDLEDLVVLLPLDGDRLRGRVDATLTIGGTVASPAIAGQGTLSEGYYENLASGAVFTKIEAVARGDGDRLVIERFDARDGDGGSVTVNGDLRFPGDGRDEIRMAVDLKKFRAVQLDEVRAQASGNLALTGSLADLLLKGDVTVDQAEIEIPRRLPSTVTVIEVTEINLPDGAEGAGQKPEEAKPGASGRVELDVGVAMPGRVFVRGRGVDSEWRGDLKITGTAAAPRIAGELNVVRGSFALAGKTFEFQRGRIRLAGGEEIDADIDMLATASAADINAEVRAQGPLFNPTVELTSTPALPRDEVLSRLLFGKNVGALNAAQAVQLAQAALELSGALGSGGLITDIRRSIGLDVLDFGSDGAGEGLSGATVRAGKYLNDDVFVGVKQGVTPESSAATVEYRVLPDVKIESSVGSNAQSDIGITYERRY